MLPPDSKSCTAARRAAESGEDDALLLQLRQLERAYDTLPPVIDHVRRDRLVWSDPITTVWTGWDVRSGGRVLLRCLRPYWRDDPVMRRRVSRAVLTLPEGVQPLTWHPSGDWPHLRAQLPGPLLSERGTADPGALAGALIAALRGLQGIHASGRWLGGDLLDQIAFGPDRPVLVWLDRFDPPGDAQTDLIGMGLLSDALDPDRSVPLCRLVSEWQHTPPPTAADAATLLRRAMSAALLSSRHRLRAAHRRQGILLQRVRLHVQVQSLLSQPIPRFRACLSAPEDQPPTLLVSDGRMLRGGAVTEAALPVVIAGSSFVDVSACRALLRAARRHRSRDDARRAQATTALGVPPEQRAAAIRWLEARLQLRSLALLLERQLRVHAQSSSSSASR